jgi:hypothetical protein
MTDDVQAASPEKSQLLQTHTTQVVKTDNGQATPSEKSEWLKVNATLVAWLVFSAFGGGLLALYYARIGYLPDIEWSASIIYLAVASIIGGGVGGLFALSLFVPGFIWTTFLVFDPEMVGIFCYDKSGNEPCVREILYKLGYPFGVVLLISHVSLIFTVGTQHWSTFVGKVIYVTTTLALLIGIALFMRKKFKDLLQKRDSQPLRFSSAMVPGDSGPDKSQEQKLENEAEKQNREKRERERRIFKYSFWFTLSVLLSQTSMLLLYRLSGTPKELWPFAVLTLLCTTGVLISNLVVAVRYRHYPRQAVAACLVAASLLLFAADSFSSLSEQIMGSYGFGENQKVNLLLNDEGAAIIGKLGLKNRCAPGGLCDVEILSKVGSEYYLSLGATTLTLPKSTVIASESNDKRPKPE